MVSVLESNQYFPKSSAPLPMLSYDIMESVQLIMISTKIRTVLGSFCSRLVITVIYMEVFSTSSVMKWTHQPNQRDPDTWRELGWGDLGWTSHRL